MRSFGPWDTAVEFGIDATLFLANASRWSVYFPPLDLSFFLSLPGLPYDIVRSRAQPPLRRTRIDPTPRGTKVAQGARAWCA